MGWVLVLHGVLFNFQRFSLMLESFAIAFCTTYSSAHMNSITFTKTFVPVFLRFLTTYLLDSLIAISKSSSQS